MNKNNENLKRVLDLFKQDSLALDENDNPYYIKKFGSTNVVMPIKSKSKNFPNEIRKLARSINVSVNKYNIDEIKDEIESMAFDEEKPYIKTAVRVSLSSDGLSVLYDLGDTEGSLIQIGKGKAKLIQCDSESKGVYFRRPDTMLPMVKPIFGDKWKKDLKLLQQYINTDNVTFLVLLGYLTYLISHPKSKGVPFPILVIQGQQGSGKSFFCNNVIRSILDPNSSTSLRLLKRDQDLAIQLENTYLAVFDNLRVLSKDFSDLFAQVATKTFFSIRQHNSYDELVSKELHAPLILNGIHDFIKESDLAERCFKVKLNIMKPEDRKTELQLKPEFDALLPKIMGAVFTLAAKAMSEVDNCVVKYPARIMDFSKWLAAIEKVLGMPEGALQKAYVTNVNETMASGTADDSLTLALQKLLKNRPKPWKGSASSLLELLQEHESSYYLPKGAGALSQRLKGQEPGLKANGIHLAFGRDKERYIIVSNKKLAA